MERNLDELVANSSVDIKEENDNKDGSVSDGRYEAQLEMASDGIDSLVPDNQDRHLEEGDISDSSIESNTTQDIVLIIMYKRKIKAKWEQLKRLLEIPLNVNQSLKWKYICSNPDLVQQRILKLKTIAEDAAFVDPQVNVVLGKQKMDPDLTTLSKQIEQILLENTDSLVISWFPMPMSFKDEDIYGELCQVLETSDVSREHEIYIDKADTGLIRLVFNEMHKPIISDLLTETMKNLKEKLRTEYVSSKIVMPGVQCKVFQHFGVRQIACKMFPLIELACDVVESNDQFVLNLLGPMLQVQNAEQWIKDNYLTPYKFEEVSFEQLNRLDEFIDVPRILEKTLANLSFPDLFWTVNKFTKSVTYCSRDELVLQKVLSDSSKCLEQHSRSVPVSSVEATEDMINDLAHFDGLSHNDQCVRMMTKNNLLDVKVTGTELDPILKEIDKRFGKHEGLKETKGSPQSGNLSVTEERNREQWPGRATDSYVLVKNIPQNYTDDDIKDEVRQCCLGVEFALMFIPRYTEAILKCKRKEDVKRLAGTIPTKILITEFPKQSLNQYSVEVKVAVKEEVRDALQNMDIQFNTKNGKTVIEARTKYQIDWAMFKLTNQQEKRRKEESACFEDIVQCTQDVWDIVSTIKMKNIQDLEYQGQKVEYTNGIVTHSGVNIKSYGSKIMVLKSCIKEIKNMEIVNISMKETNVDMITRWCDEIENNMNKQCCVYVKGRNAVFAFSELYDDVQLIKHQVLVKDGQIIITGRRGRILKDTREKAIYIKEESGRYKLEPNESGGNVIYQQPHLTHRPRDRDVLGHNPEFNLKRQAKNLQEYTTDENIKVYVYEANILKLPVDCIVNAANDTLEHGDGVAQVIAQAAGRRLDQAGFYYIRRHGKIPVGKTCVTTAGKLHYDCVIHAVGPRWSDYSPHLFQDVRNCEKDLYSALMESFLAAEERGLKSIALPAMSSVPEEVCVYHYAKATIDYSRKQSTNALKEIHFIDINASIVRKVQEMFTTMLRYHTDPQYSTEKFIKQKRTNKSRTFQSPDRNTSPTREPVRYRDCPVGRIPVRNRDSPVREPVRNTETDATFNPVYYEEERGIHVLQTERCKLTIKCGDIMKVQAAAIVSIEDIDGSGKGKIASLICGKMKSYNKNNLLSDKKRTFSPSTKAGDVYCTHGYNSGYQDILHAVLPYDIRSSSPSERKDVIKKTLKNILNTLSDRMIYSVVMSLIGPCRECKDDVQIAADAFIQIYKEYCLKPKGYISKPLQMTVVCRTKEMLDTVIKTFQHLGVLESSSETPPALPPRPVKDHTPEPVDVVHDPTYLDRVMDELAAKGITPKDIQGK